MFHVRNTKGYDQKGRESFCQLPAGLCVHNTFIDIVEEAQPHLKRFASEPAFMVGDGHSAVSDKFMFECSWMLSLQRCGTDDLTQLDNATGETQLLTQACEAKITSSQKFRFELERILNSVDISDAQACERNAVAHANVLQKAKLFEYEVALIAKKGFASLEHTRVAVSVVLSIPTTSGMHACGLDTLSSCLGICLHNIKKDINRQQWKMSLPVLAQRLKSNGVSLPRPLVFVRYNLRQVEWMDASLTLRCVSLSQMYVLVRDFGAVCFYMTYNTDGVLPVSRAPYLVPATLLYPEPSHHSGQKKYTIRVEGGQVISFRAVLSDSKSGPMSSSYFSIQSHRAQGPP